MRIVVASLTLRFYKGDGWTKAKIRKLLVNPKMEIIFRRDGNNKVLKESLGDLSYFAVYEKSGHKVFKKSEMEKHIFNDNQRFQGIEWYVDEER